MNSHTVTIGAKGVFVIPKALRERLGLEEGSLAILELDDAGTSFRVVKAIAVPVEKYTDHRKAEFILNAAVDAKDYAAARNRVQQMGLDPDSIPHDRPE